MTWAFILTIADSWLVIDYGLTATDCATLLSDWILTLDAPNVAVSCEMEPKQ